MTGPVGIGKARKPVANNKMKSETPRIVRRSEMPSTFCVIRCIASEDSQCLEKMKMTSRRLWFERAGEPTEVLLLDTQELPHAALIFRDLHVRGFWVTRWSRFIPSPTGARPSRMPKNPPARGKFSSSFLPDALWVNPDQPLKPPHSIMHNPSSSSETLIRRYYEAFNRGDMALFLSLLTEDVAHDINQGHRETGRDTFARFMDRMNGSYREQIRDLVIFASADGSRASAEFTVHGEYLKTDEGLPPARGQTYVLPAGAFFDIRDGKVARVTNYYNLQNWLKQVS
jgi:steroid delta-isomerase-like uncharacterized protein